MSAIKVFSVLIDFSSYLTEITETRLQESSTTQIAIAIAASCVVATLLINSILGLLWYKRFKGGKKVNICGF